MMGETESHPYVTGGAPVIRPRRKLFAEKAWTSAHGVAVLVRLEDMKTQPRHSKPTYRKRGQHTAKRKKRSKVLPLFAGAVCTVAFFGSALVLMSAPIAEEPVVKQKSTLSNLMSQAQVEQLAQKYRDGLAKGEAIDPAAYAAATNSSSLVAIAAPKIKGLSQSEEGIVVQWSRVKAAQGYDLYRSIDGDIWEQLEHLDSSATYYHDTNASAGTAYRYAIAATTSASGKSNSAGSTSAERVFLSAPKIAVSQKKTTADVSWKAVKGAAGYEIQYAQNLLFVGAKSLTLSADATSASITGLDKEAECYARIRALRGEDEATQKGCWSYSDNVSENKELALKAAKCEKKVKKGKKKTTKKLVFELRRAAKEKVTNYDTLQGGCYGDGYAYFALNNRTTGKSKIAKVDLATMKIAKLSKVLNIHHANDMTFNSKEGYLVVAHSGGDERGLSIVNPKTLKIVKDIQLSKNVSRLFNAGGAGIKNISGVSSIAYNAQRDCYVSTIMGKHDMLVLDADFKPIQVIALSEKSSGTYQNIEVGNDVVVASTSASEDQGGNYLWWYSWTGKFLNKIYVPKGMELENVFLKGSKLYAGFYLSGSKTKTKTVVTKKQVRNAAGKLVTRKVRQKVKYLAITRDNYIYKVSGV